MPAELPRQKPLYELGVKENHYKVIALRDLANYLPAVK